MKTDTYTPRELMVLSAARMIGNGDIVLCGTGISMLAAVAAKHIYAPGAMIVFESGAVNPALNHLPLAVSDSRVMTGSSLFTTLTEVFSFMQNPKTRPRIKGIIGAAQIDPYGNLNSTMIGDYGRTTCRFPGSGGACDITSLTGSTLVFMTLGKQRFVEQVDYLTSPGLMIKGKTRKDSGLPPGGPSAVITEMGIMAFDPADHRMFLARYYPGVTPEEIQARVGFQLDITRAEQAPAPAPADLKLLREKTDPEKLILE